MVDKKEIQSYSTFIAPAIIPFKYIIKKYKVLNKSVDFIWLHQIRKKQETWSKPINE